MSRVLIISLGCLVAATTLVARADVYQCTRNGNITFSDIPCTGDSEPVRMNVFIPSAEEVERANKRTRDIEENLASSRQQRQLEALHPEMGAKDQKMNPEMTRFSEGQSDSTT
ncbi:MAG: DUF4124 domain-containing protein, partial [Aeromonas sp.]|nr:DUF4124 domain-containing protein [Aeromonas sp.]